LLLFSKKKTFFRNQIRVSKKTGYNTYQSVDENRVLDLQPISDDAPAGENLENDSAFGALERAARGKPEQQAGTVVIPAEDPDWKDVDAQATALLARTHDLRILQLLAVARLYLRGLPGFAEVLAAIREQLQTTWAQVHPQLDPEDDNDPTLRANALFSLADSGRVLRVLRDLPLVVSGRAGKISWRDIGISIGTIEAPDDRDKLTEATIRGAFTDADRGRLADLRAALASAIADTVAIPAAFDEQAGYGTGPDLSELTKILREMSRYIDRYAPAAEVPAEDEPAEDAPGEDAAVDAETDAPPDGDAEEAAPRPGKRRGVSAASLGPVTTRADAVRLLDLAIAYYERYEPSSPLPLLIGRARRMADKNFLDILRDMAPEGVDSAQRLFGIVDE
jgi:type VI secretion system protein ImpA